jgi:hypothetical protein
MEQRKNKKVPVGKVSQLLTLDKDLWDMFNELRQPYGNINDLFEDCIKVLLGIAPKHNAVLNRLNETVPLLISESKNVQSE